MIAPPTTAAIPRDVANACKLLIALILLHATYGLVKLLVDGPPGEHGINLLIGGIVFALLALPLLLLKRKILQRRNWARWMLFALTLVETLSTFATLRESWNESVGDTVVSVISAMILIAVIGLLFARVGNDWFANQTTLPDTPPEPHQPDADPRYVTGLGYPCPCCGWKIAFVSKVGLGLGRHPKCPYCNHPPQTRRLHIKRDRGFAGDRTPPEDRGNSHPGPGVSERIGVEDPDPRAGRHRGLPLQARPAGMIVSLQAMSSPSTRQRNGHVECPIASPGARSLGTST